MAPDGCHHRDMSPVLLVGDVMKATVTDDCIACGLCIDTCPEVFDMGDDLAALLELFDVPCEGSTYTGLLVGNTVLATKARIRKSIGKRTQSVQLSTNCPLPTDNSRSPPINSRMAVLTQCTSTGTNAINRALRASG